MANATSYTGATKPAVCLRCQRDQTFHGGHKKDDPLCVFHGLNGGQALAFLRQQRAARGEGRLRQPPGDETQTERRPPTSCTGKQPRPTAASHKPVGDRHNTQSAEPSRDVRLPASPYYQATATYCNPSQASEGPPARDDWTAHQSNQNSHRTEADNCPEPGFLYFNGVERTWKQPRSRR